MKKLYGVIGRPIEHSMSPLIHNDAFQQLGLDAYYHAFHVEPKDLSKAISGLRALGVAGFNVTIPHKEAIIPLLDKVDEMALKIGAVNTVVNENGNLIGYNTDGPGYVQALKQVTPIRNKRILVIGAGGAARGILFALLQEEDVQVDLFNRTKAKAIQLIGELSKNKACKVVTYEDVLERIPDYDIIVQTTSVGMHPHIEASPLPLSHLRKGTVVSDIIYNPLETRLLIEAKARGALIQNGVQMFAYQAALAFQYWTNTFPEVKRMEKLVEERLGGTTC